MTTISLELHAELATWLQKRALSTAQTISRLLEEARMVDCCLKDIVVPEGNEMWSVWMPTRAHIYTGYEAKWTKLEKAISPAAGN